MSTATTKQTAYIVSLYNKAHGVRNSHLSQCRALGLSQRAKRGGLTTAEASAIIDELLTAELITAVDQDDAAGDVPVRTRRPARRAPNHHH